MTASEISLECAVQGAATAGGRLSFEAFVSVAN